MSNDNTPDMAPAGPWLILRVNLDDLYQGVLAEVAETPQAKAHQEATARLAEVVRLAEAGCVSTGELALAAPKAAVEQTAQTLQEEMNRRLLAAQAAWLAESQRRQQEAQARLLEAVAEYGLVLEAEKRVQAALDPLFVVSNSQAPGV